ncbi:MAG: TonB-dependent receptor [Bacteroidota bacterium]
MRLIRTLPILILVLAALTGYSQKVIKGKVVDVEGIGIPGATVAEKNTLNGTITDINGDYSFTLTNDIATLEFSFVGFKRETVTLVGVEEEVNMTLYDDIEQLDEIVVIGYQKINKSNLTGSISKLETQDLSEIPSNSIEEVLAGRVPGLTISNPSDAPGAGVNVRIRGASSFTATTPLVVVDGFPLGDAGNLKQINPADIVSVEVLKDASAASIYGSRGANGVILVTTRRGKVGPPSINFIAATSFSEFSREFDVYRDPVLLATLTDEDRINSGFTPLYVGANDINGTFFPSIEQLNDGYPTTDYVNFVFRAPIVNHNYNVSVTGGSETTQYNFGINYNTQNGRFRDDDLQKVTISSGINQNLGERLTLSSNLNFSRGVRDENSGLSFNRNITFPLFNDDGTYFQASQNDFANPAALSDLRGNETVSLDLVSTSFLEWEMTDDLKFKTQFNYSLGSFIQEQFFPDVYTQQGREGPRGFGIVNNFQSQRMVVDGYFTYDKFIGDHHSITVLAGYSNEYFEERTSQLSAQDFVNASLKAGNLSLANAQQAANNLTTRTLSSFISRFNYAFKNKIIFTYTGRVDGSSNFGSNNRFAYFPSGAISWKLQNESFMQDGAPVFTELKPRVSWGRVGNQAIGAFETRNRLGQGRFFTDGVFVTTAGLGDLEVGDNGIFAQSTGLGNPFLRWETTEVLNFGLDVGAFGGRLSLALDYYIKRTEDLLVESSLPPTSGFDIVRINAGTIDNRGIEIGLNATLVEKEDVTFNLGVVFNRNRNEVVNLGPPALTSVITDDFGNQFRFTGTNLSDQFRSQVNTSAIGQPLNAFYGAKVIGIIQSEEEGLSRGLSGNEAVGGEFLYEDINGDGVIDPFGSDRTIIGNPNPDFTAGMTFDVRYKRWDLNVLLNGSFGADIVNVNRFLTSAGTGQVSNLVQRWTPQNPSQDFPSLRQTRNVAFSDWWIQKGSFVRVQNVRLGYNFNTDAISFLSNAKLYISVDNLYNFFSYDGLDPEVGVDGVDQNQIPRLRRFTTGLRFSL